MVTVYPYVIEHDIRLIGYIDCKCYIDRPIEDIKSHWKLWVLGKQPLFKLAWDPTDYKWTDPFSGKSFNIFQYYVQLGRHVLLDRRDVLPFAFQYWTQHGITPKFLAKLWVNL